MALACAWWLAPAPAQDGPPPLSGEERLHYQVFWRLLPAGHAELTLSEDPSAPGRWKATAKASSVGYVSNIYKVNDEYESSFRNPSFCSVGIHKVINEGDRHREVKLEFDGRRRMGRLQERDTSDGQPPKLEQFAIPECVHDILSALYYARTQPLTVGKSFAFPLHDGTKTIQVRVDVLGEEEVQTPIGAFQSIRVEPDVFSGNLFREKGRMFVWFTRDARRIPVQLRAQIGAGTITATLSGIERESE